MLLQHLVSLQRQVLVLEKCLGRGAFGWVHGEALTYEIKVIASQFWHPHVERYDPLNLWYLRLIRKVWIRVECLDLALCHGAVTHGLDHVGQRLEVRVPREERLAAEKLRDHAP